MVASKPIIGLHSSSDSGRITIAQNPDSARIRFNHKVHLTPQFDADDGKLRDPKAFSDSSGRPLSCHSCHQLDPAGRYMLPIRYEQHCATCHPLLFDNANHPGVSVPHEPPSIVRGFLTERYTLDALKRPTLKRPTVKNAKPQSALDP